ncbi:hypothetical protein [Microbacterium sp. HJ5]
MTGLVFSTHTTAGLLGRPGHAELPQPDAAHRATESLGGLAIERRLNGPRRSANGGIAAGLFSRFVDADTVTVVLRRPVPLARRLDVAADGSGGVRVHRGRRTVAETRPGRIADEARPLAPEFEVAEAARAAHPLAGETHPLSDCVVCGPRRSDGMRVTPGFVADRPWLLAAPWVVQSRDSVGGAAPLEAVWAAMDCTSYPAAALQRRLLCLLGTITARVERRPRVGERLVVYSWTRAERGRRHETSAAIVDADGAVVARADATWIALRHQRLHALRFRGRV